jgi:hypothetical protein
MPITHACNNLGRVEGCKSGLPNLEGTIRTKRGWWDAYLIVVGMVTSDKETTNVAFFTKKCFGYSLIRKSLLIGD